MPRKKIFYGWWMALASAVMNTFASGTFSSGFTVLFNPIRQTFGWSAAQTSVPYSLQKLETGLVAPVVGVLADRTGPRRLMLIGWSVMGLSFLLLSRVESLWAFYGFFLLASVGMSFGSMVVIDAAIAHWFVKKRSRAMSIVYLGNGASGLLVPLLALSINAFGWRQTLTYVGLSLWAVCLPLSLLIRHKPSQYGYLPDGDTVVETGDIGAQGRATGKRWSSSGTVDYALKEALKTRAFWLLALSMWFQQIGTVSVALHIVPYLESVKVPSTMAALAVTGMTVFSLTGRLGFGFLGDFINKRYLLAASLALLAIGLFIFAFVDVNQFWLIIPFMATFSTGDGGLAPLRPALQADYFGTKNFGAIMGLMSLIGMVGGLFSPIVAGWFFDVKGTYQSLWPIFALIIIPSVPMVLLATAPRAKRQPL